MRIFLVAYFMVPYAQRVVRVMGAAALSRGYSGNRVVDTT